MRPIKKCVVCLNYVKSKIKSVTRHSLEEQVLITFLFRKISWTCLTEEEFKEFLQQWGNPSDWAALCHICEKQVNEALGLHKQIMNLIRRISDIRRKLYTESFYESDDEEEGEEDGENEAFFKLRRLLISDSKDQNWLQKEFRMSMILNYHSNSTSDLIKDGSRRKSKPGEKLIIKDEQMSDNDSNHSGFLLEATDDFSMGQSDEDAEKDAEVKSSTRNVKKRRYSDDDNFSEVSNNDDDPGENASTSSADPLWGETSCKSSKNSSGNAVIVDKWPENLARGTKECPVCKKRFVNGSSMRRHLRMTHLESTEPHSLCPHCNKTFLKKEYLTRHIESVHPEKFAETTSAKPDIECSQCASTFKSRMALKRHMHLTHGDGEIYQCNQCDNKYYRMDSLVNHKKFVHDDHSSQNVRSLDSKLDVGNVLDENESQDSIAKRTCDKCGKVFQSERVMRRHISESHDKIKNHCCDQCSKTFARRSYLFRHIYNEHSDGDTDPMPCKVCGRICEGSSKLASHMRHVHKQRQNVSCDVCGRKYSQIAALNIHKKFAHPDNMKTEARDVDKEGQGTDKTTLNDV